MSDTDLPAPSPAERGLSADQDGRLRTLAALQEHGELAPELQELQRSYRERDQRAEVRPPSPVVWPALGGDGPSLAGMTGPREVDPAVLAGDPGSAQQLERGDDDLSVLGQEPDGESSADAPDEGRPAELGDAH